MDSTANASKPNSQKSGNELIEEVVNSLLEPSKVLDDRAYKILIQDALQLRGLPVNKENVERIEGLVAERLEPKVDTHYKHGDIWHDDPEVKWIWDGWIAEGYFHTLIAMQKVGKSTFLLNLIAELIQRTPSFLNFPLFSEKKYGFVLVGPDMNRRLWGKYGKLAGLLQEDDKGQARWQEQIKYVFAEEDEIGIDRDGIKRLVAIAEEVKAQELHPIFVMDSYRALLATSAIEIEENSSRYANPLRQLKKALGKTGSTVILLHHSSIASSRRSASESNSGHTAFNSVPDQIITLKWLADAGADGNRKDRRVVMSASGRTGRVMPDQLLEQSPDWGWYSHGETGDALLKQNALNERDRLTGDDAIAYDLLNTRTLNGQPSTSNDIRELRETTSQGRGSWGTTKINRLLKKLERKGLAIQDGHQAQPGDMGGRPSLLWWTFEQEEIKPPEFASDAAQFSDLTGLNTKYTTSERAPDAIQAKPKQIIPCHAIDSKVIYEGKVWTVSEINLASGMHTITRSPGITKSDLRMLDLEPFIDPDEVL
uniref:Uncharacterized protein n=1 Tax=uncultured organism MedDCM-OCT-S09-C20 TaxID=743645 RepID=D6PKX3_9ZZZZ|nr:hypothetical protein [uncultured organism MedDCM-OCT-S09-C20]